MKSNNKKFNFQERKLAFFIVCLLLLGKKSSKEVKIER